MSIVPTRSLLVSASLFVAAMSIPIASAQDSDEQDVPAYTFLRGANVPVRDVSEAEFSEKTRQVPVEVYRDEDFGSLLMVTESGSIATLEQPDVFRVKLLGVEESLVAVRFMPRYGTTWVMEDMSWVSVAETEDAPLFLGDYDVQMVETEGVVWYVRSDGLTGRTWVLGREDEDEPPVWLYASDPDLDPGEGDEEEAE